MAVVAKIDHKMLNQMMVGRVFTVDDHIRAKLETRAKIYSHHHWRPNRRPGKMMQILAVKAKNSTVFGLFQYCL